MYRASAFPIVTLTAAIGLSAAAGCEEEEDVIVEPAEAEPQEVERIAQEPMLFGIETDGEHAPYLTDMNDKAVYMFTADTEGGPSTCEGDCARAWPPVPTEGMPQAGAQAVQSDLLGMIDRGDMTQATYAGWPLYYYQEDLGAGSAEGQDVHSFGGEWYLLRPSGEKVHGEGGKHAAEEPPP